MGKKIRRTNLHHLKSRARGGTNDSSNLKRVDEKLHNNFHALFPNTHPEKICEVLNETWIDPDFILIAVKRDTVKSISKLIKQFT